MGAGLGEADAEATVVVPKTDRNGKRIKIGYFRDRKDKWLLVATGILNALGGTNIPIFLFLLVNLIDELTFAGSTWMSWKLWIVTMVGSGVLQFLFIYGGTVIAEISAERQLLKIRKRFLHEVMRQDIGYFDSHDATTLAGRLNRNTRNVRDLIGIRSVMAATYIGMAVGAVSQAFSHNAKMAGVCFCVVPVIVLCGWAASRIDRKAKMKQNAADDHSASVALEALAAIRTVKAYNLMDIAFSRFAKSTRESFSVASRAGLIVATVQGFYWCLIFLSSAFGFWYGARVIIGEVESGTCPLPGTNPDDKDNVCSSAGDIIAVYVNTLLASYMIGKIIPWYGLRRLALMAIRETVALYDRESEIDPYSTEGFTPDCDQDIRFDGVSFSYPSRPDVPVFNNLNLVIPAGKTTALVGASGCGKSTVIQMLLKFYRPQSGKVYIGTHDLANINSKYFRDQVAWVSQEPKLFANTIAENIRIGLPEATHEQIEEVAKQANAHEFIRDFPNGYDTWVGEGGGQLSGGQKQRIAIARALLRDPKILILDEATSALDNKSEKMVQETLDRLLKETTRTVIVIAHRLTTIRNADKIVVLDPSSGNGSVVGEEGTHDELVKIPNGLYATLAHLQSVAAATEEDDAEVEDILKDKKLFLRSQSLRGSLARQPSAVSFQSYEHRNSGLSREGEEAAAQVKVPQRLFRRSIEPLWFEWYNHCLAAIAAAAYACVWPVYGVLFVSFIDVYVRTLDPDQMLVDAARWTWVIVILGVVAFVSYTIWAGLLNRTGSLITRYYREVAFRNVLHQEIGFFDFPQNSPGILASTLSNDTWIMKGWAADTPILYFSGIACIAVGIGALLYANWKLGLVGLAMMVVLVPVSWLGSSISKTGGKLEFVQKLVIAKTDETLEEIVMDVVLNIRSVTAYNMQAQMEERYDAVLQAEYRAALVRAQISSVCYGFSDSLRLLGITLLFYYGAQLERQGDVDAEWLFRGACAFVLACFQIGRSFASSVSGANGRAAASRVMNLAHRSSMIHDNDPEGQMVPQISEVEFKQVAFKYPTRPEQLVYRDVSFKIPRGKVVALVGASGCGKSTAVQLIERYYDVYSSSDPAKAHLGGAVRVNSLDIRDANLASLRSRIGLVPQEPTLFWTTVEENIAYGNPDCTPADIEEACRLANAWDFIQNLSEGLQTDVGRGGMRLSGGQKQRVAIARALVRKPDLLILDEATSALDVESERVVQEALSNLLDSKAFTTLIIAHRLSTIRSADIIVVFQNFGARGSRIAEVGSHEELMKIPNGIYRGLVRVAAS